MSEILPAIYLGGWLIFYIMHLHRGPTWWIGGLFASAIWPVLAIIYFIEEENYR